ncbi:MAG: DUF1127 domain-containing protein [Magnetospirillum sp.]|nr:DUF1127 domain-containing protein [Magnetospirillum sp.]
MVRRLWRWLGETLLRLPRLWLERSRSRTALRRLDERMLKDIGVSKQSVEWEVRKPFWRD